MIDIQAPQNEALMHRDIPPCDSIQPHLHNVLYVLEFSILLKKVIMKPYCNRIS